MSHLLHLAEALAVFVADGCRTVNRDEYSARLSACGTCEQLRRNRCSSCGCFVQLKARLPRERCPAGRWPTLPNLAPGTQPGRP